MNFLDDNPVIAAISPVPSRFYIVTTVCFGVAFIANLLFALKRKARFPHLFLGFILGNGIIMRAITLGTLGKPHENGLLFASYDYPRILFGTFSLIGFQILPIYNIRRHYRLHHRDQESSSSSLAKYLLFGSYFFAMLILIFMICFLVKGSTLLLPPFNPPQNMQYSSVPANSDTFVALLYTYYMLFWWFTLTNLIILFKYTTIIRWAFKIYCIFSILSQVAITIITFLPVLQSSIQGYAISMILQFVFIFQLPFAAIMIAIVKTDRWLPISDNANNNNNSNDIETKP